MEINTNPTIDLNENPNLVTRRFEVDFIYFDLLFTIIWIIILLYKKRHMTAFYFGIGGFLIVQWHDYFLWHVLGRVDRKVEVPFRYEIFITYFSFTYGMLMFSYVVLMFESKNLKEKLKWTILLYSFWSLDAFLS